MNVYVQERGDRAPQLQGALNQRTAAARAGAGGAAEAVVAGEDLAVLHPGWIDLPQMQALVALMPLHLVYNPNGAFLPGPQAELEADYKRELKRHFGIVFNKLFTITNLPIARFASYLKNNNKLAEYMALLNDAFNPGTVNGLMCRNTINVSWQGEVFDCDFNQMLKLQWREGDQGLHLWEIDPARVENREILTGDHCFGCTAGAGSSCGGALV